MNKKRKTVMIIAALVLAAAVGIGVYAVSNYGSQSDPLIAKSYLDSVIMPELRAEMQEKLDEAIAQLEQGNAPTGEFKVLTLNNGQKVTCSVGCQVMPRIGSVKADGADYPVLVDTSSAASVASGTALTVNHLYLVTIEGNGFTATANNTKVLIAGDYKVK